VSAVGNFLQNITSLRRASFHRRAKKSLKTPTGEHYIDKHYKKSDALIDQENARAAALAASAGGGAVVASEIGNDEPFTEKEMANYATLAGGAGGQADIDVEGVSFKDYWGGVDVAKIQEDPAARARTRSYYETAKKNQRAKELSDKDTPYAENKKQGTARRINAQRDANQVKNNQEFQKNLRANLKKNFGIRVRDNEKMPSKADLQKQIAANNGFIKEDGSGDWRAMEGDPDEDGSLKEISKRFRHEWGRGLKQANKSENLLGNNPGVSGTAKPRRGEETAGDIRKAGRDNDAPHGRYPKGHRHAGKVIQSGAAFNQSRDEKLPAKLKQGPMPQNEKTPKLQGPPTKVDNQGAIGAYEVKYAIPRGEFAKYVPEGEQAKAIQEGASLLASHKRSAQSKFDPSKIEKGADSLMSAKIRIIAFEKGKKDRKAIYAGAGVGGAIGTGAAYYRHRDVNLRDKVLKKRGMTPRSRVKLNTALYGGGLLRILGGAGAGALIGHGYDKLRKRKASK
jgi:hypothetical protein